MSETLGEKPAVIGKVRLAHKLLCELPADRASAAFHRQMGEVERLLASALMEAQAAEPQFTLSEMFAVIEPLAPDRTLGKAFRLGYGTAINNVMHALRRLQESRR